MYASESRWRPPWVVGCVVACAIAWASPAAGEDGGQDQIRQGERDFAEGRFELAFASFLEAYERSHRPALLYNIAMCQWELGRIPDAVNSFRDYLVAENDLTAGDLAEIQRILEELRPRHGDVRLLASERGAELLADGRVIGTHPLAHPLAVEAGAHAFSARLEGRSSPTATRTIDAGEIVVVGLALDEAARAGEPDEREEPLGPGPPAPRRGPRLGWWLWASLGVTGASLLALAVTGGLAQHEHELYAASDWLDVDAFRTGTNLVAASDGLLAVAVFAAVATVASAVAHVIVRRRDGRQGAPRAQPGW